MSLVPLLLYYHDGRQDNVLVGSNEDIAHAEAYGYRYVRVEDFCRRSRG
jgi:hypothetical protein